jgi:ribosomal protein L33
LLHGLKMHCVLSYIYIYIKKKNNNLNPRKLTLEKH